MKKKKGTEPKTNDDLPGYPIYPAKDDIYNRSKEETDLNPEDPTTRKPENEDPDALNEKDFSDVKTGVDLDVPGSELDDASEAIGSEDEENNYYSLGGDDMENLE